MVQAQFTEQGITIPAHDYTIEYTKLTSSKQLKNFRSKMTAANVSLFKNELNLVSLVEKGNDLYLFLQAFDRHDADSLVTFLGESNLLPIAFSITLCFDIDFGFILLKDVFPSFIEKKDIESIIRLCAKYYR